MKWFKKHKILTVIIVLILFVGIVSAAGGSKNSSSGGGGTKSSTSSSTKAYRFTERADKQPTDVEVLPNENATVGGVKMTVTLVNYTTSLGEFETADQGKTYLVASVQLENTSNKTQSYNEFDFRVQTAGGQVLDGTAATVDSPLGSGDLVAGGKISGKVVFQVPVEDGHQYLIWKPGLSSDRAIVQVK